MQKGESFHLTEENHATLGPVWLVEPRTEYTKRAEIVEPRIEGQAALRGKIIPTNGMRGIYVQTQVNSIYTHTHGIAFMHLWSPSDLCPTSLKKCKRCLWPRMFLTQITSVILSERKNYRVSMAHLWLLWTHCQGHIKVLLSLFPASNRHLPQHSHSMSRPQVSMVTEKRKAWIWLTQSKEFGSSGT